MNEGMKAIVFMWPDGKPEDSKIKGLQYRTLMQIEKLAVGFLLQIIGPRRFFSHHIFGLNPR